MGQRNFLCMSEESPLSRSRPLTNQNTNLVWQFTFNQKLAAVSRTECRTQGLADSIFLFFFFGCDAIIRSDVCFCGAAINIMAGHLRVRAPVRMVRVLTLNLVVLFRKVRFFSLECWRFSERNRNSAGQNVDFSNWCGMNRSKLTNYK